MTHSLNDLPFVADDAGLLQLWQPRRTGDYEADCQAGRAHADALVDHIRATGYTPLYGRIARAAVQAGQWSGVEIGFFDRSGALMVAGSQ